MSLTRNKLYNSIIASKISIDFENIDASCKNITKQLSSAKLNVPYNYPTIFHMESLYRDNNNDKYEIINKTQPYTKTISKT
uniref:Uncharacterized protein n=1 Tax=viral metagenome TaxID=1070528 RepID=A0A6C0EE10_9ZZZZ